MKTLDEISRKVSILFLIETKMLAAKTFFLPISFSLVISDADPFQLKEKKDPLLFFGHLYKEKLLRNCYGTS